MSTFEEDSLRYEKKIEAEGTLVLLEDGYWGYWPGNTSKTFCGGYIDEYGLHLLLDILQRRNAARNAEIEEFFRKDMSQEK